MSSLEEFTLFSNLPPELRCAIWEAAVINSIEPAVYKYKPVISYSVCDRRDKGSYGGMFSQRVGTQTIPLPMPATMHVCRESRLITQKSTAIKFNVDRNGAWLNPRREFWPNIDVFLADVSLITSPATRYRYGIGCFIKSNSAHDETCTTHVGGQFDLFCLPAMCETCKNNLDEFMEALNINLHSVSVPQDYIHPRIRSRSEWVLDRDHRNVANGTYLMFRPVPGPCGSAQRTAVRLITLKPGTRFVDEITKDPMLVIGGEDSKWKFVSPPGCNLSIFSW
ncbi:hypothetical protein M434DRAFT_35451 [Hypoxylon sp. CO27-5]|nr:hypothetical protein M434DRAFT_35451 [Hypoxylon sp. CO27-5]